jgi:GTP-binding protein HflX
MRRQDAGSPGDDGAQEFPAAPDPDATGRRAGGYEPAAVPVERMILVGVDLPQRYGDEIGGPADIDELALLVDTAGGEVVGAERQRRDRPDAATFVGKGKLADLKRRVQAAGASAVVFDNELSPAQARNLERDLGVKVLDRTELILDIFAARARTREARLQVEMAQLQYLLPRLTRLWSHLERQAGGIGTRGPGETQLETDRRLIGRRLAQLKRDLAEIARDRQTQRQGRQGLFTAALVGYTNAGKSTLMNGITQAGVFVEDRLFATLDATTRRVEIDERRRFLLTDTVGFIRRLPHHLVESFRATLQEVSDADLLVHVVDASGADPERQIDAVNRVLAGLVAESAPTLLVFNKMDLLRSAEEREAFRNHFRRVHPEALFVSAREAAGAAGVRDAVVQRLVAREEIAVFLVPAARADLLGALHRAGDVLEQRWDGDACRAVVRLRPEAKARLLARHPELRVEGRP